MLERLGWVLALFLLLGGGYQLLRTVQRRQAARSAPSAGAGVVTLSVVVSSHCAICPAQKRVVAELETRYPGLRVVTLDAERDAAQLRALAVMTVPTTLLQGADGALAQINNGYIALEPLARQVERLLPR